MTVMKEAFADLHEKYNKVIKLIFEDSKLDPDNEPYLSKYSARQILIGMKANLENLIRTHSSDSQSKLKFTAMLGSVYLYLAIIAIDTEEITVGQTNLEKCQETIKDYLERPEVVLVTLNMYNHFGILWALSETETAKSYLEKAEKLYKDIKASSIPPVDISDLFNHSQEEKNIELAWKNFEKAHTLTLYYLAQIYASLKDGLKSSVYCHNTLKRQLESGEYDLIDWALNAAALSQVFMEKNGFKQARHHLAASSVILEKYEQELNQIIERNEAYEAKVEVFKQRSADVARCWAKYGLLLLSKSKERLLNHTDDIDKICSITSDLSSMQLEPNSTITAEDLQHLDFPTLDTAQFENQITFRFVLTMQDARLVFLNVQRWLQKAESYYTLDNLASDNIEIAQDKSQLYLNLLFFEDNPENQAKLHKRRIDLLENIVANVNPQYYLRYCRQIWFELGQTYTDILNIKSDKLREMAERPSPQVLSKINRLIEKSIHNFNCFAESFKEGIDKEKPTKVSDEWEKAYLQAVFHIAALNSRYITLDKAAQLANTEKSHNEYMRVVDYSKENPKAEELIPMELSICKEMSNLLPIKLAKLRHEINHSIN